MRFIKISPDERPPPQLDSGHVLSIVLMIPICACLPDRRVTMYPERSTLHVSTIQQLEEAPTGSLPSYNYLAAFDVFLFLLVCH